MRQPLVVMLLSIQKVLSEALGQASTGLLQAGKLGLAGFSNGCLVDPSTILEAWRNHAGLSRDFGIDQHQANVSWGGEIHHPSA